MRILWVSNAPFVQSGYGTQTAQTIQQLAADGHEVAVYAHVGFRGSILEWDGFRIYPNNGDRFGNDSLQMWADHWKADQILTLVDVWTFHTDSFDRPTAAWVPVDHITVPPVVDRFFAESDVVPVAMSEHGRDELAAHDPLYAPLSIDTNLYQPRDRAEARARAGLPEDAFVVGMVAANPFVNPRKNFDLTCRAFATLRANHPDAKLYLHTAATGLFGEGIDLALLATHVGLGRGDVYFPSELFIHAGAYDTEWMSYIYSAMDVLISPSLGEGFGLPVIEAQACGTPVIASDATAQAELCGAGWKIPTQPHYDAFAQADWAMPLLSECERLLEEAYEARGDEQLRAQARDFALQYDTARVYDAYWRPILKTLDESH